MTELGIDIGGSSVKVAGRALGGEWSLGRSSRYDRPAVDQLAAAIRQALCTLPGLKTPPTAVGVCLPGLVDHASRTVVRSVNLPALNGVPIDQLVADTLPTSPSSPAPVIVTDAHAAAHDWCELHGVKGRTLALSLGTGVGACVLDDRIPLRVSGNSPGHLGQLDVSIEADPADRPLGPDGGRGGLEAYVGARAMLARFGPDTDGWSALLERDPTPLQALARAIRITHAIYRPDRIVLLGGVGLALRPAADLLDRLIRDGLTSIARPDWTLEFADDDFHAARGAARLARDA